MKYIQLLICSFLFFTSSLMANNDLYQFANQEQKTRFTYLTQQYRCLVCQNETLADSNAPLAVDLKNQIARLIQSGSDDQAITQYLVQRYGDFILFSPPLKMITYALWFGPFLLLLIGILVLIKFVSNQKNRHELQNGSSE